MVLVDAAAAMELGPGSMLRSRRSMVVDVAEQLVGYFGTAQVLFFRRSDLGIDPEDSPQNFIVFQ